MGGVRPAPAPPLAHLHGQAVSHLSAHTRQTNSLGHATACLLHPHARSVVHTVLANDRGGQELSLCCCQLAPQCQLLPRGIRALLCLQLPQVPSAVWQA